MPIMGKKNKCLVHSGEENSMLKIKDYEFWFIVGSQHLYGKETLDAVKEDAEKIIDEINASGKLPYPIVFKTVATTADSITKLIYLSVPL
ncbi:hypothetical protein [Weizmannia sp. CD-2023]|uniref:hypothetical protein n=2 Tax=Heyndrickxia TaxID=2837504 RepID=UPI002E22DA01